MAPSLKAPRLLGYVRVSDESGRSGASFISPALQRERITAWCRLYDARLQDVLEELDQSGGSADRPLLLSAIERVERGLSDGIIVAKLDRFGRSVKDALEHIERIDRAGGRLISVQDQFDLGTDHGRLVLRLMLSFAEFERDRIRTSWDDAQRNAVARGVHGGATAPAGYRKAKDGRLRRNPRTAPAISEAFRMRATGANLGEISRYLREQKLRSRDGFAWKPGSLGRLLQNRVYLGEARFGEHVHPGAHPALVDEVTWRLAQYPPVRRQLPARPGLLYGLLRCASCRSLMHTWTGAGRGVNHAYRCSRTLDQQGPCPHRAWVSASVIEALGEDLLFAAARRRPQITRQAQAAVAAAERHLAESEQRLALFRDSDQIVDILDQDHYAAGLEARARAVREAAEDVAFRRAASQTPSQALLRGVRRRWSDMDLQERRAALAAAFDAIFVLPGRGPIEERVWICEAGEAPKRLPSPRHVLPPRAFTFPTNQQATARQRRRMLAARKYGWTDEEIERRLRKLAADYAMFPAPSQFIAAGELRLYDHVNLRGGGPVWAARLGVPFSQGNRRQCLLWTEDRVRAELEEFLAGWDRWPTVAQFASCGKEQAALGVSVEIFDAHIRPHVPAARLGSVVVYSVAGLQSWLGRSAATLHEDLTGLRGRR